MHQTLKDRLARAESLLSRIKEVPDPAVVEVGVLVGAFSHVLLSSRHDLHLTMVDSWAPAHELPEAYRASGDVHAHQSQREAEANKRQAQATVSRFGKRADILHMPSIQAATAHLHAFDMVFLDADHSLEAVRADLAAWAPAVKPGCWIGGHDYGHTDPRFNFGVKQAVDEWAAANGHEIELGADFTWFCRLP